MAERRQDEGKLLAGDISQDSGRHGHRNRDHYDYATDEAGSQAEDKLLAGERSQDRGGHLLGTVIIKTSHDADNQAGHGKRRPSLPADVPEGDAEFRSENSLGRAVLEEKQRRKLPTKCEDGVLHLSGTYEAKDEIRFEGDCNITSEGKALVELHSRLIFHGEVHFLGNVSFTAKQPLLGSCILVGGSATVHPGAAVAVDGCNDGALEVDGDLWLQGGSLAFHKCSCGLGGAIFVRGYEQTGGSFSASGSSADSGGAIYVRENVNISGGHFLVVNASAKQRGGAIYAEGSLTIEKGTVIISKAAAKEGGGVYTDGDFKLSAAADLLLEGLEADTGAGIVAGGAVSLSGHVPFRNCTAQLSGSAMIAQGPIDAQAAVIEAEGQTDPPTVAIHSGNGSIGIGRLDCLKSPGCKVQGRSPGVASLQCPVGEGLHKAAAIVSCRRCQVKHTRLSAEAEECTPCPNMTKASICEPAELGVPPGTMVNLHDSFDNFTDWYFCPSREVCPGGRLKAATHPGGKPTFLKDMCVQGHQGPGCLECNPAYARPDGNVMRCVKCANTTRQAMLYTVSFVTSDVGLFASAAATVISAKKARPDSSTWLNLLMAFAAVAGIVMSAVMQTGAFNSLQQSTQDGLEAMKVPVALFQGGASSPTMSGECLLQFFGFPKELYLVHLMTSILPLLLCVILACAKGFWLALVVTVNVFLPRFVAAFGKYLVSFRVRPEDMLGGELRFDFLPPALTSRTTAVAVIASAIAFCFTAGAGSWIYVVMARKQRLQPHAWYLMCAYKPEFGYWEVERLVRKMLLALITTMVPVTVAPAGQMELVSLVLSISLLLYLIFEPYQVSFWTRTERLLLLTALVMMGLTSCLIANDLHWAKSTVTQRLLIFAICGMAAGTCMGMMAMVARAFYTERFEAAAPGQGACREDDSRGDLVDTGTQTG